MRSFLMLVGIVLGSSALSLRAAEPLAETEAPKEASLSEVEFQRLVLQLGSEEFAQREEALRRIQAIGLPALPYLRKAINHPDAEVRRRVSLVIPLLETKIIMQPKRVTLKAKNQSIKQIFDEITDQTGYKIQFWGLNTSQVYSFDFTHVTFWEAIDRICRDTGLVVQQGYSDSQLRLSNQNGGYAAYVTYDGMFRFAAQSFQQVRNINFGIIRPDAAPQASETLTLNFAMFVEPKAPFLGLGQVQLQAAYDDQRNSMLPPATTSGRTTPWGGMQAERSVSRYSQKTFSMTSSVQLRRPSEKAKFVKVMRGSIPVTLLSKQTPVVVTEKLLEAKGLKKEIGNDVSIHVANVQAMPGGQYEVQLHIAMKDPQMDYSWTSSLYQRIKVYDDKGQPFSTYSTRWGGSGPNNVQLTFTYGRPGGKNDTKPSKLVFDSWETMHTLVPFEFRDLPLP